MTGGSTGIDIALAVALVVQFAMVRARTLPASLSLLRLHLAATALAALAAGLARPGDPVAAGVLLAGAVLLGGLGLRLRGGLRRLEARTGGGPAASGALWSMPAVAAGLGLTVLAVLCISASGVQVAAQRQGLALGLASVLLGLQLASRPGTPARTLASLAVLGDGLVLLACAARAEAGLIAASLLVAPCTLLVAATTLTRAGGLPAADQEEWR